MGVLSVLSGLSTAAGKGFEGYGQDQQIKVRNALALRNQEEEERRNRVLETVAGRPSRAAMTTGVGPDGKPIRVLDEPGVSVYEPPKPPGMTTGVGPDGKPIRVADVAGAPVYVPPEKPNDPGLAPTPGPNGTVVLAPKVAGLVVPGATPTPRMARAPTEAQEKSYLFHNLMDKAEPEIETAISSGKVRPAAVSAFLTSSKIPLAGGILAALVNSGLNAEEQTLLRSGADFAAGVKRKESGAAVSNPEIAEVFGRYFPGIFGDTPELTKSKKSARAAYRETMRQSALPATMYYQQVEKQGNPEIDPALEAGDTGGGNVAPARQPLTEASWSAANPAKKGETFEQYHARYLAASGHH